MEVRKFRFLGSTVYGKCLRESGGETQAVLLSIVSNGSESWMLSVGRWRRVQVFDKMCL